MPFDGGPTLLTAASEYYEELHVPARDWKVMLEEAAPDTPPGKPIHDAGGFFPDFERSGPAQLCLAWFGKGSEVSAHMANSWARPFGLEPATPHEAFALSVRYPRLFERFGLRGAGLVATDVRAMGEHDYVCGVWQSADGTRKATLVRSEMRFYDRTIFVFSRS